MTDSELMEIYVNAPVEKFRFEVVKLSADWFSRNYLLQAVVPHPITLDDGEAEYIPMDVGVANQTDELESRLEVLIANVNDLIAKESDNFNASVRGQRRKPIITIFEYIAYRNGTFRKANTQPLVLEIQSLSRSTQGTKLNASTKAVNNTTTGEAFTIARFPMLRGFQ